MTSKEELKKLIKEAWANDDFLLSPSEIELRDSEEKSSFFIAKRLQENAKAYQEGLKKNIYLLNVKFKDMPGYRIMADRWQAIIEAGGREEVIKIHLNPRIHQQLISASPFR